MTTTWHSLAIAIAVSSTAATAWELPPDNATMGQDAIAAILSGNDYPETSGYRQSIDFIDFSANGQKFTQVVVTLTPERPRLRNGKKIVVVGGEPRFPREGTALYRQILAATPRVFIEGYRLALEKAIADRNRSLVLFWGMSTGGATLYPLAKYYTPDGYLGWGASTTGLASAAGRARNGNFNDVYEHSALRVRERGLGDFEVYTK